ncbi:hypothetical protein BWK60_10435 [Flavobacterium covae]|uniref:hypothetical protein n=1 Tax=Flavobacterium covae TaxID=2906076 RepID=UPI000B4CE4EC|nr:hypothetical protein [Flavobacterium covae]OWP86124.1 hypothetical protein BWK60_10435 [Flavobacterium covae]
MKNLTLKWKIAFKIFPIILIVGIFKLLSHYYNFELMELNALFTSLVAGTIFLIGFLISGVLSDYKESEKLPTELVCSMRTLQDDTLTIIKSKNSEAAIFFLEYQKELPIFIKKWFYKSDSTSSLLAYISSINDHLVNLEREEIQANYIIKMKNEQNQLRKVIMRMDTIRDTDFAVSAYAIVEAMAFLTSIGLIIIQIEPFLAAMFLTILITFLIWYMLFLIKDLDNPFDYIENGETGTEISLKPLHDFIAEF